MENELRFFTTLIPYNHKYIHNDYVIGRVQAVLKVVCSLHRPIHMGWLKRYSDPDHDYGYFFEVETDEKSYAEACKIIAQLYPGMCEFDLPYDDDQCCFAEDGALKEPLCLGRYG